MLRFIHTGILASLATFRFPYELGLVALSVTAFLTYGTSPNLWRNIPAGMLIVAGAWGYLRLKQLEEQTAIQQLLKKQKSSITECSPDEVPIPGGVDRSQVSTEDRHKAWREKVGSKVVEFAWEKFSNCIIQQWLYDTWWASISPDKEFPAEIRRLLNTSFGEICARAQNLDYRELLIRNCCDILTKNIELYRLTRAAVGEDTLKAMTPAARERALQAEMKASGNLHVALCAPENHYKVLRGLSESLIVHSLSGEPSLRTPIRPLLREVTSYCVLRPLIMYFLPPNLNKLVLQVLPEPATGSAVPIPCSPERKDAAALKAARELAMSKYMVEGVHLMDARVQENVVAENIMMRELAEQRNRRRTARSLVKDGRLPPPSASTPNLMSSQTSPPAPVESNMSNMSLSSSVYRSSESASCHERGKSKTLRLKSIMKGHEMRGHEMRGHEMKEHDMREHEIREHSKKDILQVPHSKSSPLPASHHVQADPPSALITLPEINSLCDELDSKPAPMLQSLPGRGTPCPASAADSTGFPAPSSRGDSVGMPGPESLFGVGGHSSGRSVSSPPGPVPAASAASSLLHAGLSVSEASKATHGSRSALSKDGMHAESLTDMDSPSGRTRKSMKPGHRQTLSDMSLFSDEAVAAPLDLRASQERTPGKAASTPLAEEPMCRLRATVVAQEIQSTSTSTAGSVSSLLGEREYVVYKIRVSDGDKEWTVTRRYRNFEALHLRLREQCPHYAAAKISIPSKFTFSIGTGQDPTFVNKRRLDLHNYLNAALVNDNTANQEAMRLFLSPFVANYDQAFLPPSTPKKESFPVPPLTVPKKETVPSSGKPPSGRGDMPPPPLPPREESTTGDSKSSYLMSNLDHGIIKSISKKSLGLLNRMRTSDRLDLNATLSAPVTPSASVGPVGRAAVSSSGPTSKDAAATAAPSQLEAMSAAASQIRTRASGCGGETGPELSDPSEAFTTPMGSITTATGGDAPFASPKPPLSSAPSAASKPAPFPFPSSQQLDVEEPQQSQQQQQQQQQWQDPAPTKRSSGDGTLRGNNTSSASMASAEMEYSDHHHLGASTPIYDLLNTVFGLKSRGFFKRQFMTMLRQTLALVAGDAFDMWLVKQIRSATSEHTVARVLLMLQASLWPGGQWFALTADHQVELKQQQELQKMQLEHQKQQLDNLSRPAHSSPGPSGSSPSTAGPTPTGADKKDEVSDDESSRSTLPEGMSKARWTPHPPMMPEHYLDALPVLDAEEVAAKIQARLRASAPHAFVRLLGRNHFSNCIDDLFSAMMQSSTFTLQVGYAILEELLCAVFPEMRMTIQRLNSEKHT